MLSQEILLQSSTGEQTPTKELAIQCFQLKPVHSVEQANGVYSTWIMNDEVSSNCSNSYNQAKNTQNLKILKLMRMSQQLLEALLLLLLGKYSFHSTI